MRWRPPPGLAVTLIPVLMGYLIRGKIPEEQKNPLNRGLIALYRPLLDKVLAFPKTALLVALLILVATIYPATRIGGEFMPPLDEGDLLYMPSALPGLSAGKASELLQQTDRLIKTVPEVASVFGKAGRAETATDPAPLEMFETTIQFKPRDQWRAGMTPEKLVEELDRIVKVPGLVEHLGAADPQPHRHAGDRHQEPGRREGGGHEPAGSRPHRRRDRARGESRCRA